MNYRKIHLLFFNPNHQNFYKDIILVLQKDRQVHLHTCEDVGLGFSSFNCATTIYKRVEHAILINNVTKKLVNQDLLIDEIFGLWLRINMVYLLRNQYSIIIHNVVKMSTINYSNIFYFIDSIFRRVYFLKSRTLIAISPITYQLLKSKRLQKTDIYLFPFSRRINYCDLPISNEIVIGIVGALNQRKNVVLLFRLLEKLKNNLGGRPFSFRILGNGGYYSEILHKYGVSYINRYLSELELNDEIKQCNALLSLTHEVAYKHGQIEYYGKTKDSGIFYDAYRNSKLVIAPEFFSNTWVRDFSYFYQNENDIFKFLTNHELLHLYLSSIKFNKIDIYFDKRIKEFSNFFK